VRSVEHHAVVRQNIIDNVLRLDFSSRLSALIKATA
jgi:hypothetical protein